MSDAYREMSPRECRRYGVCQRCRAQGRGPRLYAVRHRRPRSAEPDFWRFLMLCERCLTDCLCERGKGGRPRYDVSGEIHDTLAPAGPAAMSPAGGGAARPPGARSGPRQGSG